MNLNDFIIWVKQEGRYGNAPVQNTAQDLPTLNILTSLNARRKRIWRKSDWPWSYAQLSFLISPGTVIYNVAAVGGVSIDRIHNLIPNDPTANPPVSGKALEQRTERQFFNEMQGYYQPPQPAGNPGAPVYTAIPTKYLNLGKTPAGIWQVRIFPSPSSSFLMGGSAKGVLNTFLIGDVTGVAPLSAGNITGAANPPLDYFPDGVIEDILFEGVMGDVAACQGNAAEAVRRDGVFENKLRLLAAEEADAAKDNTPQQRKLPASVARRMRSRRR